MTNEILNKTKIQDLDANELKSFKEIFDGVKFQKRDGELGDFSENFFFDLKTKISGLLAIMSGNAKLDISLENIDIVKKGHIIVAGLDIRKANGELINFPLETNHNISYNSDASVFNAIATQIELGENEELLPFMQKYTPSRLDYVKDLSKEGLEYIKNKYENALKEQQQNYEKYGFVSYDDELAQRTKANLISQSVKNASQNELLKELLSDKKLEKSTQNHILDLISSSNLARENFGKIANILNNVTNSKSGEKSISSAI